MLPAGHREFVRLNLKAAFEALLQFGNPPREPDPVSIVFLLREPQFLNADQLCAAAERAFGVPFKILRSRLNDAAINDDCKHCLIVAVLFTMLRAGPHTLSFLNMARPYGEGNSAVEFGKSLPREAQRRAWTEHKAFTAVDYVQGSADAKLKYAVLAKLCAEMLNGDCAALYVPGQGTLVPNDSSITQTLHSIASVRQVSV